MLYYHENENDEITLDSEPLIKYNINNINKNNKHCVPSDITICIDDYYFNKYNPMSENSRHIEHYSRTSSLYKFMEYKECTQEEEISENMLGLFVASFDTKLGNVIEWQIPKSLNLEHVEFKAMASGLHLIKNDIIYFTNKEKMFGLAAFESIKIDNSEERNIRMKSVGIMAKSFKFLRKYATFLKNQVRYQLEQPGNYDTLINLWKEKKINDQSDFENFDNNNNNQQIISLNDTSIIDKIFNHKRISIYKQISSVNQIDYRMYTKFALYFGPSIFIIWKYALLNKRILFYSIPPINDLCSRVICSSEMIYTNYTQITNKQQLKPLFYVNVTDIDLLQEQPFYIACTTERIFESKEFLYDLFVSGSDLNAVLSDCQKSLLKVNSADKKRYDLLLKKIAEFPLSQTTNLSPKGPNPNEDEIMFIETNLQLNDKIFEMLQDIENLDTCFGLEKEKGTEAINLSTTNKRELSKNQSPNLITNEHIKKMGLDPSDDKDFLNELIRFYDFNLIIS